MVVHADAVERELEIEIARFAETKQALFDAEADKLLTNAEADGLLTNAGDEERFDGQLEALLSRILKRALPNANLAMARPSQENRPFISCCRCLWDPRTKRITTYVAEWVIGAPGHVHEFGTGEEWEEDFDGTRHPVRNPAYRVQGEWEEYFALPDLRFFQRFPSINAETRHALETALRTRKAFWQEQLRLRAAALEQHRAAADQFAENPPPPIPALVEPPTESSLPHPSDISVDPNSALSPRESRHAASAAAGAPMPMAVAPEPLTSPPPEAQTDAKHDLDHRAQIDQFIGKVFRDTKQRITRKDIWRALRYTDPTEFERFQRGLGTLTSRAKFNGVLSLTAERFLERRRQAEDQKARPEGKHRIQK